LCPADKIRVLLQGSCNGVDAAVRFNPSLLGDEVRNATRRKYDIPCEAIVVGFVGRLVRSKGIVELADAWGTLRQEFPSLHLLLVGPAESGDPVPREIEERLRNDPRVHLVGEEWDIPPVYATMDMLVLPTYREGFPIVLLEAAAMKLAIVATNVPGCVDAVQDGVTGTLIPPYDSRQLVAAVRRYLRDPELSHRHGEAARARVLRDFSDRAMWKAVYEEYVALLENQGIPVPDTSAPATVADTPEKIGVRSHRLAKTSS
jgi:glycosyltransferase involved in cell wall biosynthesis